MSKFQTELNFSITPIHPYQIADEVNDNGVVGSSAKVTESAPSFEPIKRNVSSEVLHSKPSVNLYSKLPDDEGVVDLQTVTKSEFIKESRRIFRQYSPTVGVIRKLRADFKEFVDTCSSKSAQQRAKILNKLYDYDLLRSGLPIPEFNREDSESIARKLKSISTSDEDVDV